MKIRRLSFLFATLGLLLLAIGTWAPSAVAKDPAIGKACPTTQLAACGKCGDGRCTPQCGETAQSCPKDCGVVDSSRLACGKCGDGRCTPQCGETAQSCPRDCGVESSGILAIVGR